MGIRKQAAQVTTSGVRTGTLTLLLLVVAIVLAVIAVLSLQTARSNATRAEEFSGNVQQFYKNDAAAQELLANVDECMKLPGATVGDMRSVLPEQSLVTSTGVLLAFIDGQPVDPDSIRTSSDSYDTGIFTDGLADEDATSVPALVIELAYHKDSYSVLSWQHVRSYTDGGGGSPQTHLFTGEE